MKDSKTESLSHAICLRQSVASWSRSVDASRHSLVYSADGLLLIKFLWNVDSPFYIRISSQPLRDCHEALFCVATTMETSVSRQKAVSRSADFALAPINIGNFNGVSKGSGYKNRFFGIERCENAPTVPSAVCLVCGRDIRFLFRIGRFQYFLAIRRLEIHPSHRGLYTRSTLFYQCTFPGQPHLPMFNSGSVIPWKIAASS